MSEKLLSRKNASRAGYAGAVVSGGYSLLETLRGTNEGLWTEGIAFIALLIGLFANQPKPEARSGRKAD